MVAKSFQQMEIVDEPFTLNGRQYVNVKNSKTGKLRQVRWYTETEYYKLYPEVTVKDKTKDSYWKPQKEILGFTNGYITIFKGDTYSEIDWFRASVARYTRLWGWYIISTEELPSDLPDHLEPVKLSWELVGNEDGSLKSDAEVKEAVESIIYDSSDSEYQGIIGERLDLYLTVERTIELDGNYGHSTMHIFKDNCGNSYVWTTASKNWAVGSEHHIRGTVKDHRKYRNQCQTILTRCLEVKNG